ncbi:MAG TPA: hypothetical protein VFQ30_08125 [Ktedonobacteraceae bacterium]|nr:hypothetical protein [Ktedonobacteraceae bacterium]
MKERTSLLRLRTGAFAFLLVCCVLCAVGLAACGDSGISSASGSNQTGQSSAATRPDVSATATIESKNHVALAQLVGQPVAKPTRGVNFQVTGRVQNRDTAQHDIFLQATLKDTNGRIIGIARGLVDNVQGGQVASYTLQGFLKQPTWATISVVITKVSENVND